MNLPMSGQPAALPLNDGPLMLENIPALQEEVRELARSQDAVVLHVAADAGKAGPDRRMLGPPVSEALLSAHVGAPSCEEGASDHPLAAPRT